MLFRSRIRKRRDTVCAPGLFIATGSRNEARLLQEINKNTGENSRWRFVGKKPVAVFAPPREDSEIVARLSNQTVQIMSFHEPGDPTSWYPVHGWLEGYPTTGWSIVVLPDGRAGHVAQRLEGFGSSDRLCFSKDQNRWRISAFLEAGAIGSLDKYLK